MSVFALKIIALVTMIIDHIGYVTMSKGMVTYGAYYAMRSIGRVAFPVYCFLLVNGFQKTSNRQRYLARLMLFAALSQIPYSMVFTNSNYYVTAHTFSLDIELSWLYCLAAALVLIVYIVLVKRDVSVLYVALFLILPKLRVTIWGYTFLGEDLNVFYTLAISLAAMAALDGIIHADEPAYRAVLKALAVVAVVVLLMPDADYGYKGFVLLMVLYLCRSNIWVQGAVMAAWCWYMYSYRGCYLIGAGISVPLVLSYRGRKGPAMKLGFYIMYPLHLLVLGVMNMLI